MIIITMIRYCELIQMIIVKTDVNDATTTKSPLFDGINSTIFLDTNDVKR